MEWAFNPGAVLELKKDLKFEKKDPTGKDLYLSAFIVWIYNEEPQKATIEFEFLKDGKRNAPPSLSESTLKVGVPHGFAMNVICKAHRKKV